MGKTSLKRRRKRNFLRDRRNRKKRGKTGAEEEDAVSSRIRKKTLLRSCTGRDKEPNNVGGCAGGKREQRLAGARKSPQLGGVKKRVESTLRIVIQGETFLTMAVD